MPVAVKRVYEKPSQRDGARVLVDRLWPRGVSKQSAELTLWAKELAPSDELRKWFHANPESWMMFRKRYLKELGGTDASEALQQLHQLASAKRKLTLLFGSRDEVHNNAIVLKDLLEGMRKPPTGTGPAALRYGGTRQAKSKSL